MASKDCIFSSSGKNFIHLSNDNRVHLWNVISRKESNGYVDRNHLSHTYTCCTWKQIENSKLGLFAVGFTDGTIIIWDLVRGIAVKTIHMVDKTTNPTDLAFSNDAKLLYVCSNQNKVHEYEVDSCKLLRELKTGKKGMTKIAINPKATAIATANTSIKLINSQSGRKKKLDSSFLGGVGSLLFSPCGCFLLVASKKSSEILLFDVRADAVITPIVLVGTKGIVKALDIKSFKKTNQLEVLCLFESHSASIFRLSTVTHSGEPNGFNPVLSQTHLVSKYPITAGFLGGMGDREKTGVVLALGTPGNPLFSHVEYREEGSGQLVKEIQLFDREEEALGATSTQLNGLDKRELNGKAGESTGGIEMLGPNEMTGSKRPMVMDDDENNDDDEVGKKSKKAKKGSLDGGITQITSLSREGELSYEQRLEQMSKNLSELEKNRELPSSSSALPTADSLVALIEQALQSGDDTQLEQCLQCGEQSVIDSTVTQLPTSRVVQFLSKLAAKFEKRPSRGVLVTLWLSSLIKHHTSYLVSLPYLSSQLAGLSQMLEHRLASYSLLSSLHGRLDLLMSQVSYNGVLNGVGREESEVFKPNQVVKED